jgi:hypothetical protein
MGNTDRAIAKWRLAKHTATLTDKTAGVILYAPNMIKRLNNGKKSVQAFTKQRGHCGIVHLPKSLASYDNLRRPQ